MSELQLRPQTINNDEVWSLISRDQIQEIHSKLLFNYLSQADDVRKWPNKGWDYAGTILKEAWQDNLVCDKCSKEWRDPIHSSKNKFSFVGLFSGDNDREILSLFIEVIIGKPCPSCNIVIFKDYGCQYMNCSAWNCQFWWDWLQFTPGHFHK